jgi:hypothetical protein
MKGPRLFRTAECNLAAIAPEHVGGHVLLGHRRCLACPALLAIVSHASGGVHAVCGTLLRCGWWGAENCPAPFHKSRYAHLDDDSSDGGMGGT